MALLTREAGELTRQDYALFRELIYRHSGISLGPQKLQLVRARLGKRLRQGGFRSYRQYYQHVRRDRSGSELCALIDAIATNTTGLFREMRHFEFLARTLRAWAAPAGARRAAGTWRIWSAGCSSGEEAYSIAMTAADVLGPSAGRLVRVLASDISTRMLARARSGLYAERQLADVPPGYRRRFFVRSCADQQRRWQVRPEIRRLIRFARLDLVGAPYPFRRSFGLIFCRNVMIYFDRPTQEALVGRLARCLAPGGYLLIGHSESLSGIRHRLVYVQPTIYRRPAGG